MGLERWTFVVRQRTVELLLDISPEFATYLAQDAILSRDFWTAFSAGCHGR
jgi:hypothetical protein